MEPRAAAAASTAVAVPSRSEAVPADHPQDQVPPANRARARALARARAPVPAVGGGQVNQRFNVDFYVQGNNVLNHTNFLNFSGNLQSPFFGRATSAAAARRIELGATFRF